MAKKKRDKRILGKLELEIMRALWERGRATCREIFQEIGGESRFAYTTILSMMRHLEQKGVVTHTQDGRAFVYEAAVARDEVSTRMVAELVSSVFGGSAVGLVSTLVGSGALSTADLEEIESIIADLKRGANDE